MTRVKKAKAYFKRGYSCSQAVLAAFGSSVGLDRRTCLNVASGFGGGMGRTGHVCGAVSGALMVLGLKFGKAGRSAKESRTMANEKVREFIEIFEERHGTVDCAALLGVDLRAPDGHEQAVEKGVFESVCGPLVEEASLLLVEMLQKPQQEPQQ